MSEDARFEDAREAPLRLWAEDAEGLTALSALVQDAVLPASEMRWQRGKRRFALLVNRFRWEDAGRSAERVQSLLTLENVEKVQAQGVDQREKDQVLSLLSLSWEEVEAPKGRVILTFAGDGAVAVTVEALEIALRDVTRPYVAPSGKAPKHPQ